VIVVDASTAVEILVDSPAGTTALAAMQAHLPAVVPTSFDAEVFNGLRRLYIRGALARGALLEAVELLTAFDAERADLRPSLRAAVRLIDSFGGHDVFYVLLAIERGCPLLTCDLALARAATAAGLEVIAVDTRVRPNARQRA
jgi:predicted nucleic acid-binding protein